MKEKKIIKKRAELNIEIYYNKELEKQIQEEKKRVQDQAG